MEPTEIPDLREIPALRVSREFRGFKESRAILVPRGFRAIPDRKAFKESKESRDLREILESMVPTEMMVHRGFKVFKENPPPSMTVTRHSDRCVSPTERLLRMSFLPWSQSVPSIRGFT
jgi:hypothetical protein